MSRLRALLERALTSRARALRAVPVADRSGVCASCGLRLSRHFDEITNQKLPCEWECASCDAIFTHEPVWIGNAACCSDYCGQQVIEDLAGGNQ